MSLNFIVNPVTLESHSIFSKQGVALLKNYVKDYQTGGALANNTLPKQFRFEDILFEIKDGKLYDQDGYELENPMNDHSIKMGDAFVAMYVNFMKYYKIPEDQCRTHCLHTFITAVDGHYRQVRYTKEEKSNLSHVNPTVTSYDLHEKGYNDLIKNLNGHVANGILQSILTQICEFRKAIESGVMRRKKQPDERLFDIEGFYQTSITYNWEKTMPGLDVFLRIDKVHFDKLFGINTDSTEYRHNGLIFNSIMNYELFLKISRRLIKYKVLAEKVGKVKGANKFMADNFGVTFFDVFLALQTHLTNWINKTIFTTVCLYLAVQQTSKHRDDYFEIIENEHTLQKKNGLFVNYFRQIFNLYRDIYRDDNIREGHIINVTQNTGNIPELTDVIKEGGAAAAAEQGTTDATEEGGAAAAADATQRMQRTRAMKLMEESGINIISGK